MGRFKSRKFWIAVGTVFSIAIAEATGYDISPEAIAGIVVLATGYIFGQGMVDKADRSVASAQIYASIETAKIQLQTYVRQLEKQLEELSSAVLTQDVAGQPDPEDGYR